MSVALLCIDINIAIVSIQWTRTLTNGTLSVCESLLVRRRLGWWPLLAPLAWWPTGCLAVSISMQDVTWCFHDHPLHKKFSQQLPILAWTSCCRCTSESMDHCELPEGQATLCCPSSIASRHLPCNNCNCFWFTCLGSHSCCLLPAQQWLQKQKTSKPLMICVFPSWSCSYGHDFSLAAATTTKFTTSSPPCKNSDECIILGFWGLSIPPPFYVPC